MHPSAGSQRLTNINMYAEDYVINIILNFIINQPFKRAAGYFIFLPLLKITV
jgi:hypothetical protein